MEMHKLILDLSLIESFVDRKVIVKDSIYDIFKDAKIKKVHGSHDTLGMLHFRIMPLSKAIEQYQKFYDVDMEFYPVVDEDGQLLIRGIKELYILSSTPEKLTFLKFCL